MTGRHTLLALAAAFAWCLPAHADGLKPALADNLQQASANDVLLAQRERYLDAMNSLTEGRQQEASDALMRMIEEEPQHAGAWLDLALIQCELGHAEEAERLFGIIEARFAPPPGIQEVIANRRASGCKGWQPRNQLTLALARGIDSNVNQGASSPTFSIGNGSSRIDLELLPEYLPQHDQYTLLSAEYLRDLNRGGTVGFAQLRVRKNDSLSRYDTATLRGGVEHPWQFGNWQMRGMGSFSLLTLGNQLYQRQALVQARIAPPLKLPEGLHFNLLTGFTRVEYSTLANFDSNTLEVSGQFAWQGEKAQAQASAGWLADHGNTARLGGNRDGWYASLQGQFKLPRSMMGELGWTYQHWQGENLYSPGLIDQIRRQDTQLVRAALTIPVKAHQSMLVEFRQVRNDENISLFQYNSRLFQVSWQWQNF